jgi:hypothetical protein
MALEKYNITGNEITLSRQDLERVRDRYLELSRHERREQLSLYYQGKHDVVVEVLKLFDVNGPESVGK